MKSTVYLETSVISYLVAKPSRNVVIRARQVRSRELWARRGNFAFATSQLVVEEAARGDSRYAAKRLARIASLSSVDFTPEAVDLADWFVRVGLLPSNFQADANHLAVCITNKIDYLVTWNCRHLANPINLRRLVRLCDERDLHHTVVCTPDTLLEL